jgi:single-stranded DNA-binding protein
VIYVNVFNQCTFMGHAGSDAKLLTTSTGRPFLKFRLGVSDYSGKDEDTLWLTVLDWSSKHTETLGPLVKKGALLLVSGKLSVRPYVNSEGLEKTEVEVIAQDVQVLARAKQQLTNGQAEIPAEEAQAA